MMNKQRILKEAQQITANFSLWIVSGKTAQIYGCFYETPGRKYELKIKFDEIFPNFPPQLIYHGGIKNLLGGFQF